MRVPGGSLVRCTALVASFGVCSLTQAQPDFPSKPIRLVIGFAPGGPSDIIGRAIALKMPQAIGQPMVVDNRAGANGIVGADVIAAPPEQFSAFLRQEYAKWEKVIHTTKIRADQRQGRLTRLQSVAQAPRLQSSSDALLRLPGPRSAHCTRESFVIYV